MSNTPWECLSQWRPSYVAESASRLECFAGCPAKPNRIKACGSRFKKTLVIWYEVFPGSIRVHCGQNRCAHFCAHPRSQTVAIGRKIVRQNRSCAQEMGNMRCAFDSIKVFSGSVRVRNRSLRHYAFTGIGTHRHQGKHFSY